MGGSGRPPMAGTAQVTSEHPWTEKLWTAIVKKDGSMSIGFGMGRYHNRGVLDAFAAVARGSEQWTVRASRELRDDHLVTSVGPIMETIVHGADPALGLTRENSLI